MSINVTVSGNPVCIRRGRMVVCDQQETAENLRKLRLKQVREQSKDISAKVRNGVRKATAKHLSKYDKENEKKIEEMRNRKLLELNEQHNESLKQIGTGHADALVTEASEVIYVEERDREIEERAIERGVAARQRQQVEKNEESIRRAIPRQTKKLVRDVENARAAARVKKTVKSSTEPLDMFSVCSDDGQLHPQGTSAKAKEKSVRKSKSPVKSTHDSIRHNLEQQQIEKSSRISASGKSPSRQGSKSPSAQRSKLQNKQNFTSAQDDVDYFTEHHSKRTEYVNAGGSVKVKQHREIRRERSSSPKASSDYDDRVSEIRPNTLISDRIRNRHLPPFEPPQLQLESSSEEFPRESQSKKPESCPQYFHERQEASAHRAPLQEQQYNKQTCRCPVCPCLNETAGQFQCKVCKDHPVLPKVPTVSLKSTSGVTEGTRTYNRVRSYDHDNRFTSSFITDTSNVHRIRDESIEVCPSDRSEENFHETKFERERIAEERGQRALEKEKIDKHVEIMHKRLPVLQRLSKVASIGTNKDKFHLSEERMKERERTAQERMEAAVEKIAPNVITLPTKSEETSGNSFRVEDAPSLNIASWNRNSSSELLTNLTQLIEVKRLLEQYKNQKDKKSANAATSPSKPSPFKRSRHKQPRSSTLSSASTSPASKSRKRSRKEILILQNTSTQTSPKVVTVAETESTSRTDAGNDVPTLTESKETVQSDDCSCKDVQKLCKILIKIQENDKPEVVVSTPETAESREVDTASREIGNSTEPSSVGKPAEIPKPKKKKGIDIKIKKIAKSSWKDELSKNDTTSSTSYYSPPDYSKARGNFASILHRKPQQSNVQAKKLPNLQEYIEKLLNLPKSAVDELNVSDVSGIPTPNSSVINITSNKPQVPSTRELIELLRRLNMNVNNSDLTENTTNPSPKDPRNQTLEDYSQEHYPEVIVDQYDKLARLCQQKIKNISERLEKVRFEKTQMLSPMDVKDGTSYLNLPESSSSSSDSEQKQLTEKLLHIDLTKEHPHVEERSLHPNTDEIDADMVNRFLQLVQAERNSKQEYVPVLLDIPKLPKFQSKPSKKSNKPPPPKSFNSAKKFFAAEEQPHQLSTIPEDSIRTSLSPQTTSKDSSNIIANILQKLQDDATKQRSGTKSPASADQDNNQSLNRSHDKSSEHSNTSKKHNSPKKSVTPRSSTGHAESRKSPKKSPDRAVPSTSKKSPNKNPSPPKKSPDLSQIQNIIKELLQQDVSSDSSQEFESMLKNMGLEWALTTLRRTKEALAQKSSSSGSGTSLGEFTSKTDSFLRELTSIPGSGSFEYSVKQTSTPVQKELSSDVSKTVSPNTKDDDVNFLTLSNAEDKTEREERNE